ncbi:hypothetical protein ACU686_19235 [Yinghuangia aomiensis]
MFELRPLPYAEAACGQPESGQSVINVTNGKIIRLLVDDEPFDLRYGDLSEHQRRLDFRDGMCSAAGRDGRPRRDARSGSPRHAWWSLTQRAVAAIAYEVEPLNGPARIVVQSELVANEQLPAWTGDPRASAVMEAPLVAEQHTHNTDAKALLVHQTAGSAACGVAAAMDHEVDCLPTSRPRWKATPTRPATASPRSSSPARRCGW